MVLYNLLFILRLLVSRLRLYTFDVSCVFYFEIYTMFIRKQSLYILSLCLCCISSLAVNYVLCLLSRYNGVCPAGGVSPVLVSTRLLPDSLVADKPTSSLPDTPVADKPASSLPDTLPNAFSSEAPATAATKSVSLHILLHIYCDSVWFRVAQCGLEWFSVVQSGSVWFRVVQCGSKWFSAV